MGKPTGFMDYKRETSVSEAPLERIRNFNEFHTPLSKEEQQIQGARCMNCGVPFCQAGMNIMGMTSGCPLHNLVPEWNDLVYTGNWEQAYNRLKKTNNFPEFTSRVCPALCEAACTCGHWGDAVTCKENEHGIIENAYEQGYAKAKPPRVRTGKKVAVIGSGPAGLAVADQLNKRGHLVTVYERDDRVGGLLMYGIPNMKLEKWVIDRKVSVMKEEGITFVTNTNVGKDVKAAKLLKEYDRVVLACGAKNPRDIKAPGRDAKGIYFAVDFLKATTKSLLDSDLKDNQYISAKGKRVVIIGGGDTGNDCVGTSIRHGAASVTQLEMMPKAPDTRAENNPWPEWPKVCKTDYGQEEAIAVFGHDPRIYQTTVKEFLKDKNGNLCGLVTVKLESKKDEKTGRMMMAEVPGSEQKMDADLVLIAARPSMGKTAFVLNIAQHVAFRQNKAVAIFSLEMSKEQLVNRLFSLESHVDAQILRTGNLSDTDWEKLIEGAGTIGSSRMIIDDTSGITISEMRSKCRKYKLEMGLDLIIIDYLQLMSGSNSRKNESRQQEISEISRSLKGLARELNVPVLALSQLSRAVEQRTDKRPMLSDLRESGAIEQDADVCMFIYRDDYYNPDTEDKNIAEIIIAKQRNGPIGTVRLAWMPQYTRFGNELRQQDQEI